MIMTQKENKPFVCYHPGETLREKLDEMGLTDAEFAKVSGLTVDDVRKITSCKMDIDDTIATVLEKYTQIPATFWLKLQENHNLYKLDQLSSSLVKEIRHNGANKMQKIRRTIEKLSKISAVF